MFSRLTFLAGLMGLLGGCGGNSPPPADVNICFVSDVRGRLAPCGCFFGQYGGLTRLKTALDSLGTNNVIRIDVGNAIRGAEDFNQIEYKYILKAYAMMGFDAVNLGKREAQLSAVQLMEMRRSSPVSLISANLLDAKTGQPIFDQWKIIRRGDFRIALVGVMDSRIPAENLGDGVRVESMEEALGRVLPALKSSADIIVLVAFADAAALDQLAQEFYELNFILGGDVREPSQKMEKANRSVLLCTGNEGRALAVLSAKLLAPGKVEPVRHEIRLLEERVPEDGSIRGLAAEYRAEVRRMKLSIDDAQYLEMDSVPGVKSAATFVGTASCAECHPSAARTWSDSRHAEAFATLVNKEADADPNCLGCHTVGFGTSSGYRRPFAGRELVDVGCESCHGPGSLHVKQRREHQAVTFKFRPLAAGDCEKCHFGEFSRPFEWDRFWAQIQHGNEAHYAATLNTNTP